MGEKAGDGKNRQLFIYARYCAKSWVYSAEPGVVVLARKVIIKKA